MSSLPKIVLIHLSPSWGPFRPYPPLNILSLAAYLKRQDSDFEPMIFDGNFLSLRKILRQMEERKPEIVGLSPILFNYEDMLKIARRAKSWNATVIVGGHYATHLAKEIISNRGPQSRDYCVDAVCRYDGEKAFYEIVKKKPFRDIDNLVFWDGRKIRFNRTCQLDLNKLPLNSELLGLIDIPRYYERQKEIIKKDLRILIIYAGKGCAWRNKTGGCAFCSIMDKGLRRRNVQQLVADLETIDKNYHPNFIYECSDSFLDDFSWLKDFCRLFPRSSCLSSLLFFARPDQIVRDDVIKLLAKIRIFGVVLGIESGDDIVLSKTKKGLTSAISEKAVKVINGIFGAGAICAFMLGIPGETCQSLKSTLMFAKKIKKKNKMNVINALICLPRPGSLIFSEFIKRTGNKYRGRDLISEEEMARDWIKNFCSVSYEEIKKFLVEMSNL